MSNLKKIKIIKRQINTLSPLNQNPEGLETSLPLGKKTEREITRQVNNWVLDWQEQKRRQDLERVTLFSL